MRVKVIVTGDMPRSIQEHKELGYKYDRRNHSFASATEQIYLMLPLSHKMMGMMMDSYHIEYVDRISPQQYESLISTLKHRVLVSRAVRQRK